MKEPVASGRDQKKLKRQASASRQDNMVLIKKDTNKPVKKVGDPQIPQSIAMTIQDPLLLNSPSTNRDVDPRIAERAYELWQHRGGHHGQDLEDWLAAEREVLSGEECYS